MEDTPVITTAHAEGLVCVQLEVHLWSGRKKLCKEDLIAQNPALADLPPESLASMGSVKIADLKDLKPFTQYKRKAELLIKASGLPMLGCTAIPAKKLNAVFAKLSEYKAKFESQRSILEGEFEARIAKWRSSPENVGWSHLIKEVPSAEYVAGRMTFGMHFTRVSAPCDDEMSELNEGFHKQITGLKGHLFADAKEEADRLLLSFMVKDNTGAVKKRDKITPKTLGPLRRIAEKFRNFAFLDPSVEPLAKMIEHALAMMPSDGQITGIQLVDVWQLAKTLSVPAKAMEAADIALSATTPNEAFENILENAQSTGEPTAQTDQAERLLNPAHTYPLVDLGSVVDRKDEQPYQTTNDADIFAAMF